MLDFGNCFILLSRILKLCILPFTLYPKEIERTNRWTNLLEKENQEKTLWNPVRSQESLSIDSSFVLIIFQSNDVGEGGGTSHPPLDEIHIYMVLFVRDFVCTRISL